MKTLLLLCAASVIAFAQTEVKPSLSGVTLDSKGQPIRKVRLTLRPVTGGPNGEAPLPYGAIADNSGKFEFYLVPPGRYRLFAEYAGYLRANYGAKNTWATGTILNVENGKPITGLSIRMREQSVISGKVTLDGVAARQTLVRLLQQQYRDGGLQLTSVATQITDTGDFRFNKLASGRYYLAVQPQLILTATTFYPGVIDAKLAEPIDIEFAQERTDVQIAAKRPLRVRVRGAVTGRAPDGIIPRVSLTSSGPLENLGVGATLGSDGTFEFQPMPPGAYSVSVSLNARTAPQQLPSIISHEIELGSQDLNGIVLDLNSLGDLRGSVKFEGFAVPPKIQLNLTKDMINTLSRVPVPTDGAFTIPRLSPAKYRINIQDLPPTAYVKSILYGEKDALTQDLDLTQGITDKPLQIVISQAGAQISGTVQGDSTVTLIPDPPQPKQPSLYQSTETDANGRFQFQGIRPGKYRIFGWEELQPNTHFDPSVTDPHKDRGVTIEVAEGDRKEVTVPRIPVEP